MIVHFICRGNAFRSIIAEAYLNSLALADCDVMSSGTKAGAHQERNRPNYQRTLAVLEAHGVREWAKAGYGDQLTQERAEAADLTVCLNRRVCDDCLDLVSFPVRPRVWSVADIGEPGRVADSDAVRQRYREEAYREITGCVDELIAEIRPAIRSATGR